MPMQGAMSADIAISYRDPMSRSQRVSRLAVLADSLPRVGFASQQGEDV